MKTIIGSVSHGTMREEDLIPAFMDVLRELNPERAKQFESDPDLAPIWDWLGVSDESRSNGPAEPDMDSVSSFLNEELFDALNDCAPSYFYFGSHPGDGADYGFWLSEGFQQDVIDGGGLVVSDWEEVPADFVGEVLHINDHGNCTLCVRPEGSVVWSEVWSVV